MLPLHEVSHVPMDHHAFDFQDVTLLITHYNRSASLGRLLQSFQDLNCRFGAIVVSDDGSQAVHQQNLELLKSKHKFNLITTPVNKGLGNNINKGQDAVRTLYTLYIQEDFVPKENFPQKLGESLQLMDADGSLDVVRFYAYFPYPYKTPYENGFSEMHFKGGLLHANHLKFYVYSDHPHLRRSNFPEKFGRYPEGIKGDETEFRMALSFIKKKGRALLYDDFTGIIDQANDAQEPSTMQRSSWRESRNPAARVLRACYLKFRLLKNSLQLALFKEN